MTEFLPITRTKLIIPRRRAELLSRPRLLALLDELLENRLIILAAPAGYGKTSLLVDFAHATQWPVCWYSIDSLDQDPQRFIAHFIAALRQRFPAFGETCQAALHSMRQDTLDLDLLVSLIINDAYEHITEYFLLVLDDFHLVEASGSVVYFVNRFLQDADENCHMVLSSRSLLTLPDLPLMVAHSQVGGLSFEELCFQSSEIQSLLRQNYQIHLNDTEAAELARDTEGWVTGLLLSTQVKGKTIANHLRVARVSGVGIYEYLAQQVFAQQPAAVQSFLLRSALLGEFDADLCAQVIGTAVGEQLHWRSLLEDVLRLNLFVLPVGEDGQSLRYHHLFQDFLREHMRRERPEEMRRILLRLAQVHADRHDWDLAYTCYQELGETVALADMVEQAGSSLIIQGRLTTLAEWLNILPIDVFRQRPALISLQGVVASMSGDISEGVRLLDEAILAQRAAGDVIALAVSLTRRSVARRLSGKYQEALSDAEEALAQFPPHDRSMYYADAAYSKASALLQLGNLNDALDLMRRVEAAYRTANDENSASKTLMDIGRICHSLGRYSEAEEAFSAALQSQQSAANPIWQANIYNNLGVLQHTRSDYVAATVSFEKAIQYARIGGSKRLVAYALASIGDVYQELDAGQETLEAYRQAHEIAQAIGDGYLSFYLNLAEARLWLTAQDLPKADRLLQSAQQMAETRGSPYDLHLCQVEIGRLYLAKHQPQNATSAFQPALAFLVEQNYRVDIPRVHFYLLMAALLDGNAPQADEQTQRLRVFAGDQDLWKRLLVAAREMPIDVQRLTANGANPFLAELLVGLEQRELGLPALRRVLRRHAVVVPFAPPKVIIHALGKVQVKLSERTLTSSDWQTQTARDLFFLLLAHPEGLTKDAIGEILWPDSEIGELRLRFKNTMYRLRHAAGKEVILFQGESLYLFNRQMDYEYDVEIFLKEINAADTAGTALQKQTHYQNAVKTYKGVFLPDADEAWAETERERLAHLMMDALLKLANSYLEAGAYETALVWCQRALKEDSCQEDAHRIAMRVYAALGNRALIIRQYEQCRVALLEEVDAPPSEQTQVLFTALTQ